MRAPGECERVIHGEEYPVDLAAVAHEALDLAAVCIRLHDQLGYVETLKDRSVK